MRLRTGFGSTTANGTSKARFSPCLQKIQTSKISIPLASGLEDLPDVLRRVVGLRCAVDLQVRVGLGPHRIPDMELQLFNQRQSDVLFVSSTRVWQMLGKIVGRMRLRIVFETVSVHAERDYAEF